MSYTKTALLPVGPDEAFALVTEPERLRRWMTVSATVELRAGGSYRWTVTPGHVVTGTFKEVEPGKRVVFGWGWEGNPEIAPDASTVTVTVEPADGGSLVTLVHEGLTEEGAKMHAEGWEHFFERLVRVATTGDAGPDEWAYAPEALDPLTAAEASLAALQVVLRGMREEHRHAPTPCAEYDVHQLAEHLFDNLELLGSMAGIQVTGRDLPGLENVVSTMADQVIHGWRARGLDGTVTGRAGELPAEVAVAILPLELVLHGWDFAQASGQTLPLSDEVATYVGQLSKPLIDGDRSRGTFAEPVPVPDDASPLEQFVAHSGRTPIAA